MPRETQILKTAGRGPNGRATPEITRFKGLGEMMPKVLWETTLNPKTRRLLQVEIGDQLVTDRVINELMGKDASARFRFIMERAEECRGARRLTRLQIAGCRLQVGKRATCLLRYGGGQS